MNSISVLIPIVRRSESLGALYCVLMLVACADLGPTGPLEVTLAVEGVEVSPSSSVVMTVTATNNTTGRIVWGTGSSSCTLGVAVRVDGTWVPMLAGRLCTTSITEHALEPGQTRTELFLWSGRIRRNDESESLPAGTYCVRAEAGAMGASEAVAIIVIKRSLTSACSWRA